MTAEAAVDARALFSTNKPNGTGFGLPLAIKIIESEHLGRLTLRSEGQRGSEVEIVLPRNRPLSES
jgi:signal transduction histidine kinase